MSLLKILVAVSGYQIETRQDNEITGKWAPVIAPMSGQFQVHEDGKLYKMDRELGDYLLVK